MPTSKVTKTTPSQAVIEAWIRRQLDDHWSDIDINCVISAFGNNLVLDHYHEPDYYSRIPEFLGPHTIRLGLDDGALHNLTYKILKYLKDHPKCRLQNQPKHPAPRGPLSALTTTS